MEFMEALKHNMVKPFEGRASRSEFWWFVLWIFIVFIGFYLIIGLTVIGPMLAASSFESDAAMAGAAFGGVLGSILISVLFVLMGWMMIALTCVTIRRLHDQDKSGWWYFIGLVPLVGPIVLLVFYCLPGTQGPNRFGPDPLGNTDADVFK